LSEGEKIICDPVNENSLEEKYDFSLIEKNRAPERELNKGIFRST
jgi:hypothetical protein